jgi:hypothetical protein
MHMPMTAYGVMTTVGNSCPRVQLPCHAPFSVSAVAEMPTLKHPSLPTLPKTKGNDALHLQSMHGSHDVLPVVHPTLR